MPFKPFQQKAPEKPPGELLLDMVGRDVEKFHYEEKIDSFGEWGNVAHASTDELLAEAGTAGPKSRMGPIDKVHLFWFSGMACDGCKIATLGATMPSLEAMLLGAHPGMPRIAVHTEPLNVEAGIHYYRPHEQAMKGELDDPYVVVLEGSATDETKAYATGGYWAGQGEQPWGPGGETRSVTASEWVARLAPNAAATIAIGTCATWGGIPSAEGNPTGAMSTMDLLGRDYRSKWGLPVVNVPGCPPIGDNFTETVASIMYFLQGFGPMPEFDELGRPAWQWGETVHRHCVRGAYYEEGTFAREFGDPQCLVEVGCWGPVVNCNITSRGFINHVGGCMNAGGMCIGCTMPGFPDKFTPFYKVPPGSAISANTSRLVGALIRPMRLFTNEDLNRESRWDVQRESGPSGWARRRTEPDRFKEIGHRLYNWRRRSSDAGRRPGEPWGKRSEWTERHEATDDQRFYPAERGTDATDGVEEWAGAKRES